MTSTNTSIIAVVYRPHDLMSSTRDFVDALGTAIGATGKKLSAEHADAIVLRNEESSCTTPLVQTMGGPSDNVSLLPDIVAVCWQYNINLALFYARQLCANFHFDDSFETVKLTFHAYKWKTVAVAYPGDMAAMDLAIKNDTPPVQRHEDNNIYERRRVEDARRRKEDERRLEEDRLIAIDAEFAMRLQCEVNLAEDAWDAEVALQMQLEFNSMRISGTQPADSEHVTA
jgi:hypothetical protein